MLRFGISAKVRYLYPYHGVSETSTGFLFTALAGYYGCILSSKCLLEAGNGKVAMPQYAHFTRYLDVFNEN